MGREDHTQTCRVDELKVLEIEHHDRWRLRLDLLHVLLQHGRSEQVKFAVELEHDSVGLAAHIDSKMFPVDPHDWNLIAAKARDSGEGANPIQARRMCRRTTLPLEAERICTRSHRWLTTHSPRPVC